MAHSVQIVIACDDPSLLTDFWSAALGYVAQPPPESFSSWDEFADAVGIPEARRNDISAAVDPDGVGPRILFERYDGGVPNQRIHIDVNAVGPDVPEGERPGLLAGERARLEELGATFKRGASGFAGETWIEMYDPEGNWFCVQ